LSHNEWGNCTNEWPLNLNKIENSDGGSGSLITLDEKLRIKIFIKLKNQNFFQKTRNLYFSKIRILVLKIRILVLQKIRILVLKIEF